MAYAVEARRMNKWLHKHGITAPWSESIRLADVLNYLHSYRSAVDSQVLAKLRTIPRCTIRSDSPQYLPLSPKLSADAKTDYAFSKKTELGGGQGYEVFGYQWMIIYYGNVFKIRLFAITNEDSKLAGVEIHAGVVDGNAHDDLIAQMYSIAEIQTTTEQIHSTLQSWILRIRQEMPIEIEHTNDTFG